MKDRVQLALSVFLDRWYNNILTKAKAGNMGAVKALSMFTPLRPVLIRELRKLTDEDATTLVAEIRNFLNEVDSV